MTNLNKPPESYDQLPDHQANALDWRNWLQRNKQYFDVVFGAQNYTLEGPTPVDRAEDVLVIALSIDNEDVWLEVPASLVHDICNQLNSDISFETVPNAYRGMFLEALLAEHLQKIETISLGKVSVSHVYDSNDNSNASRIFSEQNQPDYQTLGFKITAANGLDYPIGLKIANDRLQHLGRLYAWSAPQ